MTQAPTRVDTYRAEFESFEAESASGSPTWLRELRRNGFACFSQLGFPTARRGNEKWKYTNVAPIARTDFARPATPSDSVTIEQVRTVAPWNEDWTSLVVVDGRFSAELSSPGDFHGDIEIGSLAHALKGDHDAVQAHLASYASSQADGFTALNTAFIEDGVFVRIGPGVHLERPLNLVFITTDQGEPTITHPRVLLLAEAGSRASIIESYVGLSEAEYFTNAVSEFVLREGARIDHFRLLFESDAAYHVGTARVHQIEDSSYNSRVFEKRVGLGRYDLYDDLDGTGSSCDLKGLYVTTGTQHVDNFININHAQPKGTSRLYYKGILDGRSRAVFGGTVWVQRGADKTDSMQEDKNLVLSREAEVDSKPALYIWADDVKCGHGATSGNIDQDTVFYMRSRGIDLDTASRLLIYGFASEIIEAVEIEALRVYLEELFLQSLPAYRFEF